MRTRSSLPSESMQPSSIFTRVTLLALCVASLITSAFGAPLGDGLEVNDQMKRGVDVEYRHLVLDAGSAEVTAEGLIPGG